MRPAARISPERIIRSINRISGNSHAGDADNRPERQRETCCTSRKILPPLLLDQTPAKNAGPAIQMIDSRSDQRQDKPIVIIVVDTQVGLRFRKRHRQDIRRRDKNRASHVIAPRETTPPFRVRPAIWAFSLSISD